MQTFLPYADFEKSAKCLDNKRLGKQRVEAMQILKVLAGETTGWQYHPAVTMWNGYSAALKQYLRVVILEWKNRGFKNTIPIPRKSVCTYPKWLGGRIHRSHKSNLLRKNKEHYSQFNWKIKSNLPYVWPK